MGRRCGSAFAGRPGRWSKRKEVDALIEAIRAEIERFRSSVVERLTREIDASRAKLLTGLTPALRKKAPHDLLDQVSSKVTTEHVTRTCPTDLRTCFREPRLSSE